MAQATETAAAPTLEAIVYKAEGPRLLVLNQVLNHRCGDAPPNQVVRFTCDGGYGMCSCTHTCLQEYSCMRMDGEAYADPVSMRVRYNVPARARAHLIATSVRTSDSLASR